MGESVEPVEELRLPRRADGTLDRVEGLQIKNRRRGAAAPGSIEHIRANGARRAVSDHSAKWVPELLCRNVISAGDTIGQSVVKSFKKLVGFSAKSLRCCRSTQTGVAHGAVRTYPDGIINPSRVDVQIQISRPPKLGVQI